jgi:putative endonuclease
MSDQMAIQDLLREWRFALMDRADRWVERLPWRRGRSAGQRGEDSAARYLTLHGYRIVQRNFRAPRGEIDLIAMDGESLVFIEVKARANDSKGTPAAAVDERKQGRIRHAAEWYCARYRMQDRPVRFDVIAISGADRSRRIELLKDAF